MGEVGVHWRDFFVAEVGATAALSGLIIVAVSINIQRILSIPHLPGRALEALVLLLAALLICSLALIPAQPPQLLGGEILALEVVVLLTAIVQQAGSLNFQPQQMSWIISRAVAVALTGAPIVIGAGVLCLGHPEGLYWIAPGILIAIAVSVMNTWILLVEILR
jgi:modulator of FtsH protease